MTTNQKVKLFCDKEDGKYIPGSPMMFVNIFNVLKQMEKEALTLSQSKKIERLMRKVIGGYENFLSKSIPEVFDRILFTFNPKIIDKYADEMEPDDVKALKSFRKNGKLKESLEEYFTKSSGEWINGYFFWYLDVESDLNDILENFEEPFLSEFDGNIRVLIAASNPTDSIVDEEVWSLYHGDDSNYPSMEMKEYELVFNYQEQWRAYQQMILGKPIKLKTLESEMKRMGRKDQRYNDVWALYKLPQSEKDRIFSVFASGSDSPTMYKNNLGQYKVELQNSKVLLFKNWKEFNKASQKEKWDRMIPRDEPEPIDHKVPLTDYEPKVLTEIKERYEREEVSDYLYTIMNIVQDYPSGLSKIEVEQRLESLGPDGVDRKEFELAIETGIESGILEQKGNKIRPTKKRFDKQ